MLPVQLSQQIELIIATTNLTYYALRGESAWRGHLGNLCANNLMLPVQVSHQLVFDPQVGIMMA